MKPTGLLAAVIGLSLVTSVPVSAREAGQLDWQIAYQKVLTTYSRMQGFQGGTSKEDLGSRWDLYDVNGDNKVNISDVTKIVNKILGKE